MKTFGELWGEYIAGATFGGLGKNLLKYVLPLGLAFGGGYFLGNRPIEIKQVEKGTIEVDGYEGFVFADHIFEEEKDGKIVAVKLPVNEPFKLEESRTFKKSGDLEKKVRKVYVEGSKLVLQEPAEKETIKIELREK